MRLEPAREGVAQHLVEAALGLAGEQRDPQGLRAREIGIDAVEHRHRPGDMEPADADRDAARPQRPGEIERTGKLVGLNADQHDHAGAGILDHAGQAIGADAGIGLVKGVDVDRDVIAEHAAGGAILRQPVERRQRVRWYGGSKPLDDVAVVIVMRRLDQQQREPPRVSGHYIRSQ